MPRVPCCLAVALLSAEGYQAQRAKGQPKHAKRAGLQLSDQLGEERLDSVKEAELCVPSELVLN